MSVRQHETGSSTAPNFTPRGEQGQVKRHLTFADWRITFPLVIRSFRNRALRRYFEAEIRAG
jgi:hypothetical protein